VDRRSFLNKASVSLATAGAVAATAPRWLGERFVDDDDDDDDPPAAEADCPEAPAPRAREPVAADFAAAVARARRVKKPLLVLIVPDQARWVRGYAYGAWLNHAPTHVLASLALVEVACGTLADLASLDGRPPKGTPVLALVPLPSATPPRVRYADVELGPMATDPHAEAAIAALSDAFADLLAPDDVDPPSHTSLPARPLTAKTLAALSGLSTEPEPLAADVLRTLSLDVIDADAALIAHRMLSEELGVRRDITLRLLADAARARLHLTPITDRPWAVGYGCGVNIEGEAPAMVGCGMGSVPKKSRRFLHLYTTAERNKPSVR